MVAKRIEAQLRISAIDSYSSKLKTMGAVTGKFADGVKRDLAKMQDLRGPLKLIKDHRDLQQEFNRNSTAADKAKDRFRDLQRQLIATEKPSRDLREKFSAARKEVTKLEGALKKNRAALVTSRSAMSNAGIDTANLTSEQRRLSNAVDAVNPAMDRQIKRLGRMGDMQAKVADGRAKMDRALATSANLSFAGDASMRTGRSILRAMKSPVQTAIEFESAMSDVRKVVDFDTPDGFSKMSDDIMKLSTRIPMAAKGLAEIVAAGGQSGMENSELLQFAEMAAKVGVAFDISADTAGTSMAKIKTALGLSLDDTGLLFDAINHLSNKMASEAPNILEFTRRVAVDGEVTGFDPTETLAFGSAMIAAGAQADVAATSFRNMANSLTRGKSATKRQAGALKDLGLNSVDVANMMQEDAVGTTLEVLRRINEMIPEAQQKALISDLFGNEARALTPLIGKVELLEQALGLVANKTDYVDSAEREYAERAKTTANNLQLTRNHMARLGESIGSVVLPPLNELLISSQGFIDKMVDWTKEHPKLTKALVIGGTALGAMAVAGGALLTVGAGIIGTLAVMRFGMVGLSARAAFVAADLIGIRGAFRGLMGLPKFKLSTMLTPLKWTSKLIPKIGWAKLAGRLVMSTLITPLKWTAAILPNFAPALARFVGFRIAATAQMARLSASAAWHSALIGGAFAKGLGRFLLKGGAIGTGLALGFGVKPTANGETSAEEQEALSKVTQEDIDRESLGIRAENAAKGSHGLPAPAPKKGFKPHYSERRLDATTVTTSLRPVARPSSAQQELNALRQQIAAIEEINSLAASGPLPTSKRLERMGTRVEGVREEIRGLEADLAALTDAETQGAKGGWMRAELDGKRAALKVMQQDLTEAQSRADRLGQLLQLVGDTDVSPVINDASIDRALQKAKKLAAELRSLPQGGAGAKSPSLAGKRARGGPVGGGLPYLVNEDTPRSEVFVPSRSGGILNVSQAQSVLRSHLAAHRPAPAMRAVGRLGVASLTALSASLASPAAAVGPSGGGASGVRDVKLVIENIAISVPPSVTDPQRAADIMIERMRDELAEMFSSSFED